MAELKVYFNNGTNVFLPGQLVNGFVVASITRQLDIAKVIVTFLGKSTCRWSTGSGKNRKTYTVDEPHFAETLVLTGSSSSDPIIPDTGEFKLPFSFRLPPNIPPTFHFMADYNNAFANTEYTITVILKRNGILKRNVESMFGFLVEVPQIDSSQLPHLLETVTREDEKFLCCCCCESGPIVLRLQLEKQVFYAGEPIAFHVEIDNSTTKKRLGAIEGKLVRRVTLSNTSRNKKFNYTQGGVVLAPSFNPGSQESWNVQLNVDVAMLDPTFENSKCVSVTYFFVLKVKIPWGMNAEIEVPVTILPRCVSVQRIFQPIQTRPPVGVEQHQAPGPLQPMCEPHSSSSMPVMEQPGSSKPSFNYSRL